MWKVLFPLAKWTQVDPKANVTFNLSRSYTSCAKLDLCVFFPIILWSRQLNTQCIYSTWRHLKFLLWSERALWPVKWQRGRGTEGRNASAMSAHVTGSDMTTTEPAFWQAPLEYCALQDGICPGCRTGLLPFPVSLTWLCMASSLEGFAVGGESSSLPGWETEASWCLFKKNKVWERIFVCIPRLPILWNNSKVRNI